MLPSPPKPIGSYASCIIHNGMGLLSGQFPIRENELLYKGLVGRDLTLDEGREAAALAASNALAQINHYMNGLSKLLSILRMDGTVASAADFYNQSGVLDAASDVLLTHLGPKKGLHARSAYGAHVLPYNASIELTFIFAVV